MKDSIKKKLLKIIANKDRLEIISSEEFYFSKAQEALDAFLVYNNMKLINEIVYWNYQRLLSVRKERNEINELYYSPKFRQLISYFFLIFRP